MVQGCDVLRLLALRETAGAFWASSCVFDEVKCIRDAFPPLSLIDYRPHI